MNKMQNTDKLADGYDSKTAILSVCEQFDSVRRSMRQVANDINAINKNITELIHTVQGSPIPFSVNHVGEDLESEDMTDEGFIRSVAATLSCLDGLGRLEGLVSIAGKVIAHMDSFVSKEKKLEERLMTHELNSLQYKKWKDIKGRKPNWSESNLRKEYIRSDECKANRETPEYKVCIKKRTDIRNTLAAFRKRIDYLNKRFLECRRMVLKRTLGCTELYFTQFTKRGSYIDDGLLADFSIIETCDSLRKFDDNMKSECWKKEAR